MLLGQILLEAQLITNKQLSEGLDYGKSKNIFLGKVMKLLKFLDEDDVERALHIQILIRCGLSPVIAVEALRRSCKEKISIRQSLQECQSENLFPKGRLEHKDEVNPENIISESATEESFEKLLDLGDKLLIEDYCSEAEKLYERAKLLIEAKQDSNSIELASVYNRLGNTCLATNRFEEAKNYYEKVLDLRISFYSREHPYVAQSYENIADLYHVLGEEEEAINNFLLSLDILEKFLPAQLGNYASVLRKVAKSSQAILLEPQKTMPVGELLKAAGLLSERELQLALKMSKQSTLPLGIILRENLMVGDREIQSALKAQFCVRQGVLTEKLAIDLLSRAARREISLQRLLHEAGVMVSDETRFEIYREIAADLDRLVAAESSEVATQQELAPIAYRLGTLYEQVGDSAQAEIYYARALKIWGAAIQGNLTAAKTFFSLAKIYKSQNRLEESLKSYQKSFELRMQVLGANHEDTIETLEECAQAELECHEFVDALKHAELAVNYRENLGQIGAKLLRAVVLIGDSSLQLLEYDISQNAYKRAMTLVREGFGGPSVALASVIEKLGDLYSKQELYRAAATQYRSALMIFEAAAKKDSAAAINLQTKLNNVESKSVNN